MEPMGNSQNEILAITSAGNIQEFGALKCYIRDYYGWDAKLAPVLDQHRKALIVMFCICLFKLSTLNIGAAGDSGFSMFSSESLVSQKALHVKGLMS